MRLLVAALAMVLMVASAQAQVGPQQAPINSAAQLGSHASNSLTAKQDEQKLKANEKAYNAALRNLPDKQYDPWHGVR